MKIDLILLAAGNSRRFGTNKLLFDWQGKPLYRHMLYRLIQVAKAGEGGVDFRIWVVTQYQEILDEVSALPCTGVFSPRSSLGMSYTIRAALHALREAPPDCFAFFTADMPYLTADTISSFLKHFLASKASLGCGRCGEVCGNPAVFSWEYVDEFETLTGDSGGKRILMAHREACFFYDLDPREWRDIDRPEDF